MKESQHLIAISIIVLMVVSLCAVCATTSVTAADVSKVPAGSFVGSAKENHYHYPQCGAVKNIHQENLVVFSSVADACAHGYHACQSCNPPPCPSSTPIPTPTVAPTVKPTVTPTTNPVVTTTPTPSVNPVASSSVAPTSFTTQQTKQIPEFPLPLAGAATMVIVAAMYVALRKRP